MSTANPIIIDGTKLEIPNDRAVSITTPSGIRIELAAQPKPEPVKVVETPELAEKKKSRKKHGPYTWRTDHEVQAARLRLARAVARAGSRGISMLELRDRLGLPAEAADTALNDLTALRRAGLVELRAGLTTQTSRYVAVRAARGEVQ